MIVVGASSIVTPAEQRGMSWSDTGQFISYLPRMIDQDEDVIPRADFVTGTVDAQSYLNWLNTNGYNINMTAQ